MNAKRVGAVQVLDMEAMPDIIQHIHIKAGIQKQQKGQLGKAFPQRQTLVQYIQAAHNHGHNTAESIDSNLIVCDGDGLHKSKLAGQLG